MPGKQVSFEQWVNTIRVEGEREQIAFDGKVVRGSGNGSSLNALQLMSATIVCCPSQIGWQA